MLYIKFGQILSHALFQEYVCENAQLFVEKNQHRKYDLYNQNHKQYHIIVMQQ